MVERTPDEPPPSQSGGDAPSFFERHDPNDLRHGLKWASAGLAAVGAFIGGKVAISNAQHFADGLPDRAKEAAVVQMADAIQDHTPTPEEFKAEFARRESEARQRFEEAHDSGFVETAKGVGTGAAIGAAVPPVGFAGMIGHSMLASALRRCRNKDDREEEKTR